MSAHVVGAHLVAEAARAGVDQHRHLVRAQPERLAAAARRRSSSTRCSSRKWLPQPSVPSWSAPRARARSETARRVGAAQAPVGLGALEVLRGADAVLARAAPRPARQHAVERRAGEPQRAAVAGADRHAARDLVHERLGAATELGGGRAAARAAARRS